jgi:hypothetical protein
MFWHNLIMFIMAFGLEAPWAIITFPLMPIIGLPP